MKKLLQEFKAFVNKGSVIDLAVGMIIGSAFTAIVTSLVKYILTPLINWIPGTSNTGALQVILRQAVVDTDGNVITPALIMDFGEVISAIITFLLTAIVLFIIIKIVNKAREVNSMAKDDFEKKMKAKKHGKRGEVQEAAPAPEPQPEPVPVPEPTTNDYLKEIIGLLKEQTSKEEEKK